jgi:hypothetical protein
MNTDANAEKMDSTASLDAQIAVLTEQLRPVNCELGL